ncbi:MAG: UDP-N-acetylmuramoyl-L-alanyl-D-glutamate--2,6-diaminopimelate ligase [Geobacter sp.]|nr:UDP-N-acetylmuramoyl-L-alanyl-D-glutamate--2,6-diaminopimelate ligase [Geobacter sp.]
MRLKELIAPLEPLKVSGDCEQEILGLHYDSRTVQAGGLFFALRGVAVDGHRFIAAARGAGAVAFVVEDESAVPAGASFVKVADARKAMALMAATFYGWPTRTLPVVGITGTNGKTTTTYLVEGILAKAGLSAAVLGTVSYRFGERTVPAPHTTPESVELQKTLREFVDMGAKSVVMEVSSHALEQHRVDGCLFDVGAFTNLTRDHLDYHVDMESYFASKARLFSELLAPDAVKPKRCAVINIDDPYGARLITESACGVISFGLGSGAQVTVRDLKISRKGITGTLVAPGWEKPFSSQLLGRFNLYNLLTAAAVGVGLNLPPEAIVAGLADHRKVPGRLERVENDHGITLLVDYAHTGDALENVLRTVSELADRRMITVFGCGGDRDPGKRPVMGEVAGRYSDLSIITSDNPRTEDPLAIIDQVRQGIIRLELREYGAAELPQSFADKGFVVVPDRREAIRLAVSLAEPGDIVLLAGKGHEDYQIIGKEKLHFDDREEAVEAFRLKSRL